MTLIKATIFLCKEYKRLHPKASVFKFLLKLLFIPDDELYRIADAVYRFGAENFYR